jgi:secondary thiamine-phosphate synthase enzyme
MKLHQATFHKGTTADTDLLDVTDDVAAVVRESGVDAGLLTVFVSGSTASVTTIEYESGAVSDLRAAIDRLAPRDIDYAHDARWGDGNGYSHVRAALLGPSLQVPVENGRPRLGTWQQVLLCDWDNRPRSREVFVQVLGEGA